MLFNEQRLPSGYCKPVPLGDDGRPVLAFGAESFSLLFDGVMSCVKAGRSATTDVFADSTAIWVALHGVVTLRTALPGFPWPEKKEFVRNLVLRLARILPDES